LALRTLELLGDLAGLRSRAPGSVLRHLQRVSLPGRRLLDPRFRFFGQLLEGVEDFLLLGARLGVPAPA